MKTMIALCIALVFSSCAQKEAIPEAPLESSSAQNPAAPLSPTPPVAPMLTKPPIPPPSIPAPPPLPLSKTGKILGLGTGIYMEAKCFKSDDVKWWENAFCIRSSGSNDVSSDVFLACQKKHLRGKSLPKKRCDRIKVLKQLSCSEGPEPLTKINCLQSENFQKMADENPEMFFGG